MDTETSFQLSNNRRKGPQEFSGNPGMEFIGLTGNTSTPDLVTVIMEWVILVDQPWVLYPCRSTVRDGNFLNGDGEGVIRSKNGCHKGKNKLFSLLGLLLPLLS
jgi:hypothetical protein